MNIQAMMKQAQKLQKEMLEEKGKIDAMQFEATSSFVTVKMTGDKKVSEVIINMETLEKEDIEILQDLIVVATKDCLKQIDAETEKKMGKYTQGMPGLF